MARQLKTIVGAILFVTLIAANWTVQAQEYPNRVIRWVVPLPPGSPTDIFARKIAAAMSKHLNATIIVDNKIGGATTIAATEVARSKPDGYTLLFAPNEPLVGATVLVANLGYDPAKDFTFITRLTDSHPVLVASKSVKARTLNELAEESKQMPSGMNYGSFGVGSFPHLILEAFAQKTGAKFVHVPYQGSPPALRELLNDQISLTFGNFTIAPQADSGALRVMAQTGNQRSWVRDVPTFAEQGFTDPIFRFVVWNGLLGPAGLPDDVVRKNVQAAKAAAADPEMVAFFREMSTQLIANSPDEFLKEWRAEYDSIPPFMRKLGITAN